MAEPLIIADMCELHMSLLVKQTGYRPDEPWRWLIVTAQIALFQATTTDETLQTNIGYDVMRTGELGCLACLKPDAFGAIVEAAKDKSDLGAIRRLGDSWVTGGTVTCSDKTSQS